MRGAEWLDNMKVRASHIAIIMGAGLLLVSVFGSLFLAALSYWQIHRIGGWRDEVYGLVGMTATTQAMDDYREGHLRLYTLGGECDRPRYIGTNNGAFEVWVPQFYPSLGRAHRYAKEQFIEFYNRKMHYMYAPPDKFVMKVETVQPDNALNKRLPAGVKPNPASPAAASAR